MRACERAYMRANVYEWVGECMHCHSMYTCMYCVRACARACVSVHMHRVYVWVFEYVRMYMCACVRARAGTHQRI